MPGPLTGIKVLDLSRIVSGPYCTMVLSDLGAEVIKVEHPNGGDTARGNGPFIDGLSAYFTSLNRGKKSITIDLSQEAGRDLLLALVVHADVLVENFLPGTMKRFGLSYDRLAERNPRLVYCAVSGFGQEGPYAKFAAMDVVVQGMGGILSITGEPGGPPIRPGASYGDITAGLFSAIGILSALMERTTSGRGQMLDISMLDCQVAILENAFSRYFATGETPQPLGTRHPAATPFQAFAAKDGWVVVAIMGGLNDMWPLFCSAIERVDLIDKPGYGTSWERTQRYTELGPILAEAMRQRTVAEWVESLRGLGIPCGPVNGIPQVAADPQVNQRGMFVDLRTPTGKSFKLVNTPVKLSRTAGRASGLAPDLGQHTEAVLAGWLGLNSSGIARLRREKAI